MKKSILLIILCLSVVLGFSQKIRQSDWQQQVSYQIDVVLDDVNHELNGELKLTYWNNSPDTLTFIYMHLWPNAYSDDNTAFAKQMRGNNSLDFHYSKAEQRGSITNLDFKSGEESLEWNLTEEHKDIAIVYLDKPLMPGQSTSLSTPFKVDLPFVFSRLGHDDQDYYLTQWYPKPAVYDVNGWNPMPYLDQGEFYSEFGLFQVNITLPKNYVVAATGELKTKSEIEFREERQKDRLKHSEGDVIKSSEELKTITFIADNVHDFAWFASKYYNIASKEVVVGSDTIDAYVYSYEYSPQYLDPIKTALKHYSKTVGRYPYPHASVVKGEIEAGGGMEYPMITVCDIMMNDVIIHEVGHNWFYGILANNERAYPWMDESINSFYDNGGNESTISGAENFIYDMYYKDGHIGNEVQAIGDSSGDLTWNNYGVIVYGMGAKSFGYLKEYLGEERYDSAMQYYFTKWQFRHPLPGDMKDALEESTGEDLTWFFDDLLGTNKRLDYGLKKVDGKPVLYNNGEIDAPIPVAFPQFGKMNVKWYRVKPGEEMVLDLGDDVSQVKLDPKNITLDVFSNNDAIKKGIIVKPFIGRDIKAKKELYLMPTLGWNGYDGFMLGFMGHNYSVSNKPVQWYINPMFGFESEQLTGLAGFNFRIPGNGPGAGLDLNMKVKRFTFSQGSIFNNFLYTKVQPSLTYHFARESYRSKKSKSIALSFYNIDFSPNFNLDDEQYFSGNDSFKTLNNWKFITLKYSFENKRAINGYAFSIELEQAFAKEKILLGTIDTVMIDSNMRRVAIANGEAFEQFTHTKLTAIFEYDLDIGIKKKPMNFRAYFSYFITVPQYGYFLHKVSSTAFVQDYRFDEIAMFRNTDSGMYANQVPLDKDRSRFVGTLGQSNRLMFNLLVTVPLPGKIPLKPYIELMTFTDIEEAPFNSSSSVQATASMIYNLGVELTIIPSVFSIYFNLAQTSNVSEWQNTSFIDKGEFHKRITFSLDLNNLTPPELKQNINLF